MSTLDLTGITYEELARPRGRKWLFKLSRPVPYTCDSGSPYCDGDLFTDHVIVSWGKLMDTLIAPAVEYDSGWEIADFLGYWGADGWVSPEYAMRSWLKEKK